MKRTLTYIFLGTMAVFFAVVLYLFLSSLLSQQKELEQDIENLNKLVKETAQEREQTEKLAEELAIKEEIYRQKLEQMDELLARFKEENEKAVAAELSSAASKPIEKEVAFLAKLPVPEISTMLQKAIEEKNRQATVNLAEALKRNRDAAFEFLSGSSVDNEDIDRKDRLIILGLLRDPRALPLFRETLKNDPGPGIRDAAAAGLINLPDTSSLPVLIETLQNDSNTGVRIKAATALGIIKDASAAKALMETFRDAQDLMLRNFSLTALARIAHPDTSAFFISVANDSADINHGIIAVVGLQNIGTPEAITALKALASSDKGEIAEEARKAIADFSGDDSNSKKGAK